MLDGDFLHICYYAHIVNLIVQDGFKVIDDVVVKIKESVKYIKGLQVRKQKFLECIQRVPLDGTRDLRHNIPIRWNSTYLMLDSSIYYQRTSVT